MLLFPFLIFRSFFSSLDHSLDHSLSSDLSFFSLDLLLSVPSCLRFSFCAHMSLSSFPMFLATPVFHVVPNAKCDALLVKCSTFCHFQSAWPPPSGSSETFSLLVTGASLLGTRGLLLVAISPQLLVALPFVTFVASASLDGRPKLKLPVRRVATKRRF